MKIKYWFPSVIISGTLNSQEPLIPIKPLIPDDITVPNEVKSKVSEKLVPSEVKDIQAALNEVVEKKEEIDDGKIKLLEPPLLPNGGLEEGLILPVDDDPLVPLIAPLPDGLPEILRHHFLSQRIYHHLPQR